ncbi:hypothetical protein WN943_023623 [Citrus x changshan-huyou]
MNPTTARVVLLLNAICAKNNSQSCSSSIMFELPKEIQITCCRPHCLLHYERESGSKSKELDCDFCNKIHRDYKYCCRECDFQIGVGCASKLINYHQGQRHVRHFSHRHPLTLLKHLENQTTAVNYCKKSDTLFIHAIV